MLGINVFYTMKPGTREEFVSQVTAQGLLQAIRQEEGCLEYGYYFSAHDPDLLLLVEKWTAPEAQKVHMTQPHMETLGQLKEQYALDTKLEFYQL